MAKNKQYQKLQQRLNHEKATRRKMEKSLADLQRLKGHYEKKLGKTKTTTTEVEEWKDQKSENKIDIWRKNEIINW